MRESRAAQWFREERPRSCGEHRVDECELRADRSEVRLIAWHRPQGAERRERRVPDDVWPPAHGGIVASARAVSGSTSDWMLKIGPRVLRKMPRLGHKKRAISEGLRSSSGAAGRIRPADAVKNAPPEPPKPEPSWR